MSVFDAPETGARAQLAVGTDIELEQLVFKTFRHVELPGNHLIGLPVPADDDLGPRATGGTADVDNILGDAREFAFQHPPRRARYSSIRALNCPQILT